MQVAKSSTIPSANDVIDCCCRRDFIYKPHIVATFFFQPRAAFELFYSTFSSGFKFSENKSEKNSTSENKYIAATYVLVCTQQKNWDFSNFSKFLEKSQTVCRNRSFCWAPLYLLILEKSAISPIFGEIAVFAGQPSTSCTTWLN